MLKGHYLIYIPARPSNNVCVLCGVKNLPNMGYGDPCINPAGLNREEAEELSNHLIESGVRP